MTTAFDKAWVLLKNRGHAPMRGGENMRFDPEDYLSNDELAQEGLPVDSKDIPLEYDPVKEEKMRALAEMMEQEGEDEMPPPRGPPSDIGVAGSMGTPEKPLSPNPFQMKRKPSL